MTKIPILSLLCLTGVACQLWAAEPPGTPPASTSETSRQAQTVSADDLQKLKERIAQQEEEIKKLQKSVEEQQQLLNSAVQSSTAPTTKETAAAPAAPNAGAEPAKLVPVSNIAHPGLAPARWQRPSTDQASPLSFSIGNTTFSPLGFVDFTFFARSTNTTNGIGTGFGGIPFNNTVAGHASEMNMSLQNSRLGMRIDSKFLGYKILGYLETDFLGNQATSVFVTSNADTLRLRNFFVDMQKDKFEILAGQDWSMITPNRHGLSPLPSDIFYTQNMDTNYQAGLVWFRQAQLRLIAHPTDDFAFGVSLENPQQYTSTFVTFPAAYSSTLGTQFNNGSGNYAAINTMPDIIVKAAYDGHAGTKIEHIEAAGVVRTFKDTLPVPATSASNFQTNHITEASGSVNANLEVVKNFRIIANTFFGAGNGRFIGTGLGPDVIVHADGTLSPVHAYSTVDGFEANITKNDFISVLYGGAYFSRNTAIDATGKPIGFGFSGSTDNRSIQEITFDYQHTFWKNLNYGALTLITQYSYLFRDPWTITNGQSSAHTNMVWLDLRYTLP
ncbi:MAG TPA: hypothetical protein VHZ07_08305 [Bryobacteraceae bacterium]|jgi:hypothetical protein|nr:hypothetical protein [Bryobacteraceae bacterium]